ncbi:helix-turn-helix domain-containing protein [Pseudofrankia sp. BMG5.37]|uniref:helix-turn-helix domain-containing protein n=1 Tax=Pseudofrankia sp. BMG5.37 TaxID=3050035 RepID=UPI0028939F18|nr:helix-turn-helix domain-containing protein [Pseudofrankia sp. BMG5.37]MDT3441297.1 helix-turn-helix domain-containing protein [Pseudofrankia sp. BMG5.37]
MSDNDNERRVPTDGPARITRREYVPKLQAGTGASGATVGQVVGENLRRIREERRLTQHEAALRCQTAGLPWTRVRVAAVERGARESVDLGTLRVLADAFDVELAEFFAGAGDVILSPRAQQTRAGLRAALRGVSTTSEIGASDRVLSVLDDETPIVRLRSHRRVVSVDADQALAERLSVELADVLRAADGLWGHSLTEERDRRVAALGDLEPGERQAHRGHITRELARDVEDRLGKGGEP